MPLLDFLSAETLKGSVHQHDRNEICHLLVNMSYFYIELNFLNYSFLK